MADMRSYNEVTGTYQGYSGRTFMSSATITRPADTTQYAAGDQVAGATASATALSFGTCAVNNAGGGVIIDGVCTSNANQSTKPNQRLYIFSGSPTLNGDNAAWLPSNADVNKIVGIMEFTSWEVGGTGSGTAGNVFSFAKAINQGYTCATGQQNLWGAVVERGTYTPVSSELFTYTIKVSHD